jgi:ferritin-like metal-binding protein YciE
VPWLGTKYPLQSAMQKAIFRSLANHDSDPPFLSTRMAERATCQERAAGLSPTNEMTIMPEDMKTMMTEKLGQAYTAEKLALENLPKLAQAATSPTLKQAFETHRQETEQQIMRLEQAGQQMGRQIQGAPCEAMEGLVAEAERLIAQHQPGPMLDVILVAAAQGIEHHEIAAYGTMRTLAQTMGINEVADLLAQTLQEEKATDEKLTMLAESEINPAALQQAA